MGVALNIKGCVALVTGANGGIGTAYVAELLEMGAKRVYLAVRDTRSLAHMRADERLTPLTLDVTHPADVSAAASTATDVSLLINNAGYSGFVGAISALMLEQAHREMQVNYFGMLSMTRAFAPILAAQGGEAVINMLSMLSLVTLPMAGTYSASKAAALSATRSIRAELALQGTQVIGVLAVQTETSMGELLPPPRLSPKELVADALEAVQMGTSEEIFAGGLSRSTHEAILCDPVAFQANLSTRLPIQGNPLSLNNVSASHSS